MQRTTRVCSPSSWNRYGRNFCCLLELLVGMGCLSPASNLECESSQATAAGGALAFELDGRFGRPDHSASVEQFDFFVRFDKLQRADADGRDLSAVLADFRETNLALP